jgi:hypothetical protein
VNRIKTVLMRRQPAILGLAAVLVAVLVSPSSASVVEPRGGKWTGKTAQGLPIEFVVKKNAKGWKVVSVEFEVRASCRLTVLGGTPTTSTETSTHAFPVVRGDDGTVDEGNTYGRNGNTWGWVHSGGVEVAQESFTSDLVTVGRFLDKRKAKGRLSFVNELHDPSFDSVCRSGNVRWTARP